MAERRDASPQDIETLTKRYTKLRDLKAANEGELKTKRQRLEELQREARDQWGTDDLAELEAKLEEMKRQNEESRRQYQASLDSIDARLAEVTREYETARGEAKTK